jgi:phage-related protein
MRFGYEVPPVRSVLCTAKFEEAVYVLHAFQKKTRKTSQADIKLAAERYKLTGRHS